MKRTTIALPEPLLTNFHNPVWIGEEFQIEITDAGIVATGNDYECAIDDLTPAEARAFGAALIAASYEAEQPTTLGDKGVNPTAD